VTGGGRRAECRGPEAGCRVPDEVQSAECRTKCRVPRAGRSAECRVPGAGCPVQRAAFRLPTGAKATVGRPSRAGLVRARPKTRLGCRPRSDEVAGRSDRPASGNLGRVAGRAPRHPNAAAALGAPPAVAPWAARAPRRSSGRPEFRRRAQAGVIGETRRGAHASSAPRDAGAHKRQRGVCPDKTRARSRLPRCTCFRHAVSGPAVRLRHGHGEPGSAPPSRWRR
jgi:hypothetical protein